jgi:hypothetical protein
MAAEDVCEHDMLVQIRDLLTPCLLKH